MKFGVRITRSLKLSRDFVDTSSGGEPSPLDPVITKYDELSWDIVKKVALECEELGYDLITVPDHLVRGRAYLECWTTLSALAGVTKRINLGTMVLCNEWRYPSVLAKMAATLDFISGGRLEFGIGAGYNVEEFNQYGIPFRSAGLRIRRLEEAVQIIKKMWTEDRPSFKGNYYSINNVLCEPKPVQKPHPPVIIGGSGYNLLRVVAKHADACNFGGTPEHYMERLNVLEKHCSEIGRDFSEIEKTWGPWFFIYKDEKELKERVDSKNMVLLKAHNVFMGTPDEVVELLEDYEELGVTKAQLLFVDLPSLRGIRLFAEMVIPKFK
jgi:probable F420-dependent oxidoreductase